MYLPRRWPRSSAAGRHRSIISSRSIASSRLATITSSLSKSGRIKMRSSISSSTSWHPPCEIERHPKFKEHPDVHEASSAAFAPRRNPSPRNSALGALGHIGSPGQARIGWVPTRYRRDAFRLGGVPEGGRRCHLQRYFPWSMLRFQRRTFGCSLVPHRHSIRIRFATPADPRCRQASACWRRRSPPNPEGITGSLAFSAMPAITSHPGSIISGPTQSNLTRCSKAADSQTDDDQCQGVAVSIILKTSELRLKAENPGTSAFRLSDRAGRRCPGPGKTLNQAGPEGSSRQAWLPNIRGAADHTFPGEQFHARSGPNNAITLSGKEWLRPAEGAGVWAPASQHAGANRRTHP